jgi:hypothetical protein
VQLHHRASIITGISVDKASLEKYVSSMDLLPKRSLQSSCLPPSTHQPLTYYHHIITTYHRCILNHRQAFDDTMIGLRQNPLVNRGKRRPLDLLVPKEANTTTTTATNDEPKDASDTNDDNGKCGPSTEEEKDVVIRDNKLKGSSTATTTTSSPATQKQQRPESNNGTKASTTSHNMTLKNKTKITMDNGDKKHNKNSWKSIVRDLLIALTPIFVLYKLSTHPMINQIGYVDPNAPKRLSREEALASMMHGMAIKKWREKTKKRQRFLKAIDATRCYDFPDLDEIAKEMGQQRIHTPGRPRRKFIPGRGKGVPKRSNIDHRSSSNNKGMKRQVAQKQKISASPIFAPSSSPSSTPWGSVIMGTFNTGMSNTEKGINHALIQKGFQQQKKGQYRPPAKKKFSSRRVNS